ncbi:MFS transporter [Candidatus Bathyarchaeota archaeon]|nr:MFS transporter [Candidatus Bathyarchaeota archaeon]MBS7630335.1 MFS transporter [Candidatus Bathyarchaeota archaeon]
MSRPDSKKAALIVSTLASFLTPFAASSFNIALPTISAEYSLDAVSVSWAALSYLLSSAMFLIPFGKIADIFGRRRIFLYGVFLFGLSCLLLAISPSGFYLIMLRALQGAGAAMIFGTSVAILVSEYPPIERGTVLGINSASVYIGLSTGPYLGGLLTGFFGWRSIFYMSIAICITIIVFTILKLKRDKPESSNEGFDIVGSFIYSLTLLALMYGFSIIPSEQSLIPIFLGLLGSMIFIWHESRIKNPVMNITLFRHNKTFAFSNLAMLINFSATYAINFLLSLYLQYLKGLKAEEAGLILISTPVVQAILSPLAGRLSDRFQPGRIASVGMAITVLAIFPLTFIYEDSSIEYTVTCLALMGAGLAFFSSPNINAIISSVGRSLYGEASATFGTMRLLGQMLSMGIALIIFSAVIGRAEITPPLYPSLMISIRIAFMIFSILCIVGVFASLLTIHSKKVETHILEPLKNEGETR